MFSINLDIGDVVLEDGGDVDLGASRISLMFLGIYVLASLGAACEPWPRSERPGWWRPRRFLAPGRGEWDQVAYLWECALGENTATDISTHIPLSAAGGHGR